MPTLSLCMIAKNEEQLIKNAILSVKPFVDEMIVVDTGSTDKTQEIIKECGAQLHHFEWVDDFAKAHNYAISKATSDWILFLHADECMTKQDMEDIRKLIAKKQNNEEAIAYSFLHRNYAKAESKGGTMNWTEFKEKESITKEFPLLEAAEGHYDIPNLFRLFKNNWGIKFHGKIHESILPSIEGIQKTNPNYVVANTTIPIHHLDFLKASRAKKHEYYFELSKKRMKTTPDAKNAIDVAVGYILQKDIPTAIKYLKQAVQSQGTNVQPIDEMLKQGKITLAIHNAMSLLNIREHQANHIFNLAKAFYRIEQYQAAIVVCKRMLQEAPTSEPLIEYLGVCYDRINRTNDAVKIFEHGVATHPSNTTFWFSLAALYEKKQEWQKAIAAWQKTIQLNHPQSSEIKKRILTLRSNY